MLNLEKGLDVSILHQFYTLITFLSKTDNHIFSFDTFTELSSKIGKTGTNSIACFIDVNTISAFIAIKTSTSAENSEYGESTYPIRDFVHRYASRESY